MPPTKRPSGPVCVPARDTIRMSSSSEMLMDELMR